MDHKAQLRFVENIDNFMGFFNNILLEEFVGYSLIFMRSHYSVRFSNIFVQIDGIQIFVVVLILNIF